MARFAPSLMPLRPSNLRRISGPTSPASPISPCTPLHFPNLPSPRARRTSTFSFSNQIAIEPPSIPMPWIWSCHKCHTRYLLGATRRCLTDGHYFCGGVTVDQVSGRVKKHKACVSEFDYSGWEDYSRWKRATSGQITRRGSKHCEDECNFPSSCHWNEQHVAQDTGSAHHDPGCLNKEPDASPVERNPAILTVTEDYIGKVEKEAEKGSHQVTRAVLSPIEEEAQKASYLESTPKLNGLSLHYPVMDFSGSRNGAEEGVEVVEEARMKLMMPASQQMSARLDSVWETDVEMMDWMAEGASKSPPISPCAQAESIHVPFDFQFAQDDGVAASLADEDSPVSPLCSRWDWTIEDIGVALSPPQGEV